jgi:GIY-YIG catalytic domain/NUMOD3 motif
MAHEHTHFIYALCDPDNSDCRYVGVTKSPNRRLTQHCTASVSGCRHCWAWIIGLKQQGKRPRMEILETIPAGQDWEERERFWIAEFKQRGARLTNLTEGGQAKRVVSAETRQRLREISLGNQHAKGHRGIWGYKHTEEARAKIRASMLGNQRGLGNHGNKGQKRSPEAIAKAAAANRGQQRSEDFRAHMRQVMKGNQNGLGHGKSPELRSKISEAVKKSLAARKARLTESEQGA